MLEPGIYAHYKRGNQYKLIGVGRDSDTEEEVVIYQSLYDDPDFPKGTLWVRKKDIFLEAVEWNGKTVQRFKKITPETEEA